MKVPAKQAKRGRLYLHDGSCIRLQPCWENHVWSYDFVSERLHNGKKFRMLTVIDEFSRRCLAIKVDHQLKADQVLEVLAKLFLSHGMPDYIRSDNGAEFTAKEVRGSHKLVSKRLTSLLEVPGRMVLMKDSMVRCGMNY